MKYCKIWIMVFLGWTSVQAQSYPTNPEIIADGIFQFFAESDQHLRRGNIELSILTLDNAIAQNPFFAETYLRRSRLLARYGRHEEAKQDFLKASNLNPFLRHFRTSSASLNRLELLAFDLEEHEQFMEDFALPGFGDVLRNSTDLKLNGDFRGALEGINYVMAQLDRPPADLYGYRAHLRLLLNDYEGAVADYTTAISLSSDAAKHLFNRGVAQLFTYHRSAACNDLEESLQLGFERSQEKLKYFCYH